MEPALSKYGYWRGQPSEPWHPWTHDFKSLWDMAASWNAKRWLPADAPRGIEVLDAMDRMRWTGSPPFA